jgi:CO dehydrogenase maturation factor
MKPLQGKRILVCGKGGSGKSSIITLMANELQCRDYKVILLDGDASNPGGLARLAVGAKHGPKPLIDFFGGREMVECPVDNPSPLIRLSDGSPVIEAHIDLEEIPREYFIRKNNLVLLQVGKIRQAYEGCDGPMSKVTRDFIVKGEYVTLIDVEAGIEHFGRGVEKHVDIVLIIADPTFESFEIAERVTILCRLMGIKQVMTILNGAQTPEMESMMRENLKKRRIKILGSVRYDPEIRKAGLEGKALGFCPAQEDLAKIIGKLEMLPTSESEFIKT